MLSVGRGRKGVGNLTTLHSCWHLSNEPCIQCGTVAECAVCRSSLLEGCAVVAIGYTIHSVKLVHADTHTHSHSAFVQRQC